MSLFDKISSSIGNKVGAIAKATSLPAGVSAAANRAVGKYAPRAYDALRALQRGDYAGAVFSGLNAIRQNLGISSPLWNPHVADLYFQATKNPLLGGITPEEAARIHAQVHSVPYSKKNLFFLELRDWNPPGEIVTEQFNMFATEVNITGRAISTDPKQIGMGVMDSVSGSERVELRITTYDDTAGTLRRWFDGKLAQIARPDGTVGVPADYLIGLVVVESAINDEALEIFGGYRTEYVLRAASIEKDLSRSEDAFQQLQMTFVQFDTFMYQGS